MHSENNIPTGDFSDLQPDRYIGRFRLLQRLGEGGFGVAWQAVDPQKQDEHRSGEVVLKFLHPEYRRHEEVVADFKKSYRVVQQLIHQSICPLFDLGDDVRHGVYQVMPFIPGMTLQRYLRQQDPDESGLGLEEVLRWLRPAAEALDFAHGKNIVHRDVKPANLMVNPDTGELTVLDFGLAADLQRSLSSLNSQSRIPVRGTPIYMPPEQWKGARNQQRGALDQYSLAVVAWQMLTGGPPWEGDDKTVRLAVLNDPVPPLPEPLRHLQSVFEKALAKDWDQRFGKVVEFVDALAAGGSGVSAPKKSLTQQLEERRQSLSRAHAQARQLQKQGQYAAAVKVLEGLDAALWGQRDEQLLRQCIASRDRVLVLRKQVETAVQKLELRGLRAVVEELVGLEPGEEEWGRLLGELPVAAAAPVPTPMPPAVEPAPQPKPTPPVERPAPAPRTPNPSKPTLITNGLGMKFIAIPGGEFMMGSDETVAQLKQAGIKVPDGFTTDDERPVHRVRISPFQMGIHEVTRGQFATFVQDTGYKTEAETNGGGWGFNQDTGSYAKDAKYNWRNPGYPQTDDHPVVLVSWNDAQKFLEWLSKKEGRRYRLPTEAEWEYACRAGSTTRYAHGNDPEGLVEFANVADGTAKARFKHWAYTISGKDGYVFTAPVGSFRSNAFGLYDMHGNVFEWCADWYNEKYYASSPGTDPTGPLSGSFRVLRGGSWGNVPNLVRCAYRSYDTPGRRGSYIGFRLVLG